jgi:hypothetical protein
MEGAAPLTCLRRITSPRDSLPHPRPGRRVVAGRLPRRHPTMNRSFLRPILLYLAPKAEEEPRECPAPIENLCAHPCRPNRIPAWRAEEEQPSSRDLRANWQCHRNRSRCRPSSKAAVARWARRFLTENPTDPALRLLLAPRAAAEQPASPFPTTCPRARQSHLRLEPKEAAESLRTLRQRERSPFHHPLPERTAAAARRSFHFPTARRRAHRQHPRLAGPAEAARLVCPRPRGILCHAQPLRQPMAEEELPANLRPIRRQRARLLSLVLTEAAEQPGNLVRVANSSAHSRRRFLILRAAVERLEIPCPTSLQTGSRSCASIPAKSEEAR